MDPNREQIRRLFNRLLPYWQRAHRFCNRFPLYVHVVIISLICWSLLLSHFLMEHEQFYPAVIAISKSKVAQILFEFECAAFCYFFYKLLVYIFFAPLTAFEREEMNESNWIHIMDSLLFLTLVRGQTSIGIFGDLVVLTITKGLIMLADMRVDVYAVAQDVCRLSHAKNLVVLLTSIYTSSRLMESAYYRLMEEEGTEIHHLVLGAEHLIIITAVLYTLFKYKMFHYCRQNPAYHRKEELLKGAEVVTLFVHCVIYLALVLYITVHETTPLFLFRNLYHSTREFAESFLTWRRARAATWDLEKNILDISADELAVMDDNICAICRDEMTIETRQKRLACGHCFHMQCMRDWFQRQPRCPTCRTDVHTSPLPPPLPPLEPIPDADEGFVDGLFAALNQMPQEVLRLSNRLARMANHALDGEDALLRFEVQHIPIAAAFQTPLVLQPEQTDFNEMSSGQLVELLNTMRQSLQMRAEALDQALCLAQQAHRNMLTEMGNARRIGRNAITDISNWPLDQSESYMEFCAYMYQLRRRTEEINVTIPTDPDWMRPQRDE